jgi:membrane-bound lytic murein transglycosylase D
MRGIYSAAATLVLYALAINPVAAATEGTASISSETFLHPPAPAAYGPFALDPRLEARVKFWVDIYAKYNSWETVIHDVDLPQVVYAVVNTKNKPRNFANGEKRKVWQQLKELAQKKKQIEAGKLKREQLKGRDAEWFAKIEAAGALDKIEEFADMKRIRGQAGLRDGLLDALFMSGRYLPRMEKVFENFKLPIEIAYLPFVESGFNKRAVSKVGASGIWQFMPYTGKLYLRVDEVVDERNDPMRAAEAAARLMKQNYEILGEWPLAITAYNHGALGVARAAKETGSKALADIIEKFEGKSFGFASQNFYCSFLAALHVAKNSDVFLGAVPRARKLEFDEFVMPHYIDLKTFLEKMEIEESVFRELNPGLTSLVYSGKRYIPVGYTVRVPVEMRGEFFARYEKIPSLLKHAEQKADQELPALGINDHKTE